MGGQEPSPCAEAEAHLQQSREVAKELEKGSSYELTGAKLEKKEQLLREGFVDWTRKDFRSFLNAMERRGRDEVDVIARETSNETGKTEEEDAFLLNMMHTYGYGNWERIRVEIRNAWQFNFDWFFKSRNASELGRRADLLIKLVEKENSDLDGRSRPK